MNDLSEAFGSALFLRILLPGLIVSVGLHPLILGAPILNDFVAIYPGGVAVTFFAEVIGFGLISYAAALPVFHIAQGLVWSPLTSLPRWLNTRRFNRKYACLVDAYGEKAYSELPERAALDAQRAYLYLSDYPVEQDEDGQVRFVVRHATRIGNITATYERYPDSRYGINAESYWDHFMVLLPDETRKELSTAQALGSGTLLSAAGGWLVTLSTALVFIGRGVGTVCHLCQVGPAPQSDSRLLLIGVYGCGCVVLFNYLARVAHREYGRQFRAAFDVHSNKLANWKVSHAFPFDEATISKGETFRVYSSALQK